MPKSSPSRWPGFLALLVMLVIGVAVSLRPTRMSGRGVVVPQTRFSLHNIGAGRYASLVHDGRAAGGPALRSEQVLRFDQSALTSLSMAEGLQAGVRVNEGQALARLSSPTNDQRLAELRASKEALAAQRALLGAGARSSEVEEARTRLSLARSRLSRDQAELRRLEGLSASGAVSTAELDAARLNVEVRQVEVSVAAAGVGVTESGARPEALAEVEAQIAAQEARIAAMEAVLAQDLVKAPFAGQLIFGRAAEPTLLLAIEDTSTAVIRVPVPQQEAGRVEVGATAWVEGPGFAHTEGKVIDVATAAEQIGGQPMIWVAMTVPNAEGAFKTGMTARVEMEATGLSLQHLLPGAS